LGTDFEYTRTVGDDGQIVDPFVPKFDIMKVKDLSKEIRVSQKVNVESPRFTTALERALVEMFQFADKDQSGNLSYQEFSDAFKKLSYGLSDEDIQIMIAIADENNDGMIEWEEFIPVGLMAIKTFLARNNTKKKHDEIDVEINKEALRSVYWDEIKKCYDFIIKKFEAMDTDKNGTVTLY
jgi:Ca2+-binding EF-hand superfamily protein